MRDSAAFLPVRASGIFRRRPYAGGPIGKVQEGDLIEIVIDRERLTGSVHLVGDANGEFGAGRGNEDIGGERASCGFEAASGAA